MTIKKVATMRGDDTFTDDLPPGIGRIQWLVWSADRWVGVNIYTAITLMDDLRDSLDFQNIVHGAPNLPDEAEVDRVATFCIKVKPYYGQGLSHPARKVLCSEYAHKIATALDGRLEHTIRRGESHFFPASASASKTKVA